MNSSISLSSTTHTLSALLGGAGTPEILVFYHDLQLDAKKDAGEYPIGVQITTLNGTNETNILAAPAANVCRHIDAIICGNDESGAITLTIIYDVATTNNRLWKKVLQVDQSFTYTKAGVQII